MPSMGKIRPSIKNPFADVTMNEAKNKERLLNKLSNFKPEQGKFVDAKKHNKMGKDEFLKLLTHQLTNQDPVKPMDQKDMAGQLAQFSQLEQLANLNSKFEKMSDDKALKDKFYAASFLGKEVITTSSSLKLSPDKDADVLFSLPKPASKVMVRIFDKQNALVGEMWKENIGDGNQNFAWDGTSLDGTRGAPGDYRVQVVAWDHTSEPIKVDTKSKGTVQSVSFEGGETVLTVDGKRVFLRDVDSFHNNKTGKMQVAENTAPRQNLPSLEKENSQVRLEQPQVKPRKITTGITDVYDVE